MLSTSTRKRIRAVVPWWSKGALKLSLARLPLGYPVLRRLALAQHGDMQSPAAAFAVFKRHFDSVDFHNKFGGFRVLELGPGDSLFTALIAAAHGAASTCLVDVSDFAGSTLPDFRRMASYLSEQGLTGPDISAAKTVDEVMQLCHATYEVGGLDPLRALPDESFDFIFSNAVVQAIWREQVLPTLKELRRLIHPQGCSVHSIDLRDMLDQSLQHLRFSEKFWESNLIRTSGFYVNRFRLTELQDLSRDAGFEPRLDEVNRWPRVPLPRRKLTEPYQHMPEEELQVATIRLVLAPA